MNFFRVIFLAALLGLIWPLGCGGPDWSLVDLSRSIALRPAHFGFTLPYPVAARPFDLNDRTYRAIVPRKAERLVPIILQIDTAGQVRGVTAVSPTDSGYARRYSPFLEQYRFEPGLIGGAVSPMALLVEIHTSSFNTGPIIRFPVDPNRRIHHSDLYWRALAVLGIDVPVLARFPSYYYELDRAYRWQGYPLKLYRVYLDNVGRVEATELVFESGPEFGAQIRSAIHWGEYTPLKIDGHAVESSNFLVVSLYPMVKYPAPPIDTAAAESALWDRARVMLLPDTIGFILPPVPRREWSGEILDSFHQGMTPELVSSRIAIDTIGRSRLSDVSSDFSRARQVLNARSHNIRFFPAIGLDGSPQPFEDLIYLRYLDESNVRIWFDWLGGSDPGHPVQVPEPQ